MFTFSCLQTEQRKSQRDPHRDRRSAKRVSVTHTVTADLQRGLYMAWYSSVLVLDSVNVSAGFCQC